MKCSVIRPSDGFTLIELLVVIVIITILAAILFPVFASAREKSRQTACLSNEKQIGLAVLQYNEDYDECYPCGVSSADGAGWATQIFPYVKTTAVYVCPDDPNVPHGAAAAFQPISYAYNWTFTLSGNQVNNVSVGPVNMPQLNAPSLSILFCEIQGDSAPLVPATPGEGLSAVANVACDAANTPGVQTGWFTTGANPIGYATGSPPNVNWTQTPTGTSGRHTGGSNYIGADGHCKWLPSTRISAGRASSGSEQADAATANSPASWWTSGNDSCRPTGTNCMDNTVGDTTCAHPNTASMTFSKL